MFNNKIYLTFLLATILASCKKEKKEYDSIPVIEFISITPDPVTEYQPLVITFKYSDGDGDLGENDPNVKNLFVTDKRIGITYSYRIKQLSPENSIIPIQGSLEVKIDNAVINGNSVEQLVNYSIYIVDRSGHSSNIILTPSVIIRK